MLVEHPQQMHSHLEEKLGTGIIVDHTRLHEFSKSVKGIRVLRSVEIATVAFELGLFRGLEAAMQGEEVGDVRRTLLESLAWGMKLAGCSVSKEEVQTILSLCLEYPMTETRL